MLTSLALLVAAGLLGPLLAAGRRPLAPVLVGELVAGAVLGRTWLHVIDATAQPFPIFSALGFAMLMLSAGTEVDLRSKDLWAGAARAAVALAIAFVIAIPLGVAFSPLAGGHAPLLVVLLAGSSAAVAFPIIQERRLGGPAVALLIAWMTVADATTALAMPLTLTGSGRILEALLGDALIVAVAVASAWLGHRLFRTAIADEAKLESKNRSWALQLRISVLFLLVLAVIAEKTGASLLVAGFAAGMVLRQFHEPHRLVHQLTGLANGFFVPAFFVLLGATLDFSALVRSPAAIALALTMALGATTVHLVAALVAGRSQRIATGLLASAQLGLPAAAASLGLASGAIGAPIAAALVAGGILTLVPASVGASLLSGHGSGAGHSGASHPAARRRSSG